MQLADAVRKYDAAARHYDRFMDVVFGKVLDVERHRERIVSLLGDMSGKTVVDVGCGTGRNLPLLARAVGEQGRIIGIDCSKGMLERAGERVRQLGLRNVELMHDDAVELGSIREPVDGVLSVWCYGTVYDLPRALHRAVEVLRPGGSIAVMTFVRASPERGPLRWFYPLYRAVVRCTGIDPSKEFDNASLEARWADGRKIFRELASDVREESYLEGAGLILAGRKPPHAADFRATDSIAVRSEPARAAIDSRVAPALP